MEGPTNSLPAFLRAGWKTALPRRTPCPVAARTKTEVVRERGESVMISIRKLFVSVVATCTVLLSGASIHAEQPDKYTKPHEPFTAYGMQVRMSVIDPINKTWHNSYQAIVFQEIAQCRLTSTLTGDHYDRPWG